MFARYKMCRFPTNTPIKNDGEFLTSSSSWGLSGGHGLVRLYAHHFPRSEEDANLQLDSGRLDSHHCVDVAVTEHEAAEHRISDSQRRVRRQRELHSSLVAFAPHNHSGNNKV